MYILTKLVCSDYGYDCDFDIESENAAKVIDVFGTHMSEEHGIDYPKEALMQFIVRKNGKG